MPYCGECKLECRAVHVDFGIGPHEFWGAKYNDVDIHLVSNCCESDVFEDENCTINCEESCDDGYDYERDDFNYHSWRER